MVSLIYCSIPSRLVLADATILSRINEYVVEKGELPLNPFVVFPSDIYDHPKINVQKEQALDYYFRFVDACERLWLFGISDGTLRESSRAKKDGKAIGLHLDFDPEWMKYYPQLKGRYGDHLDDLIKVKYG